MSNKKFREQYDSDQKDLIISQLKAELYEHHQYTDYEQLNNELNLLELKYSQHQDDLVKLERDGRQRAEQDLKTLSTLRSEIEILKSELHTHHHTNQQSVNETVSLKEMVQIWGNELDKLKRDIRELSGQQTKLQEQRRSLEKTMTHLSGERDKLQVQNDEAQVTFEEQYQQSRLLDKKLRDAEYDLGRLEKSQGQQSRNVEQLIKECKQKQEKLQQCQLFGQQQQQLKSKLQQQYDELQLNLESANTELSNIGQTSKQEQQEQRQLHNELIELDSECRQLDLQIEDVLNQADQQNLKKLNNIEDSKFLNVEISRALDIINQLSQIKKELCNEIEKFSNEDAQVRSMLEREERQNECVSNANVVVNASLQTIQHFIK